MNESNIKKVLEKFPDILYDSNKLFKLLKENYDDEELINCMIKAYEMGIINIELNHNDDLNCIINHMVDKNMLNESKTILAIENWKKILDGNIEHSKISISDLGLSVRTYNCLKRAGIMTLSQLVSLSIGRLHSIRNLGLKSTEEIISVVGEIMTMGYERYIKSLKDNNCAGDSFINDENNDDTNDILKDGNEFEDLISDKDIILEEVNEEAMMLKEKIKGLLGTLKERERRVLELRFGILDGRARTLEEVGKELQVTRERVRQLEDLALRKLKERSKKETL